MKIGHILFPVDFSDHSRAMNSEVAWLVSHFNSRATLLHVFEVRSSWYGGGEAPIVAREDFVEHIKAAKQRINSYATGKRTAGTV